MEQSSDLGVLITLTKRILNELELLTSSVKAATLIRFQNDFLVTEQQRKIYEAINGERDSQAIADVTGASIRAVQLLIKELAEKDLISVVKKSRSFIPIKDTEKITTYYAKLDIKNAGGESNE